MPVTPEIERPVAEHTTKTISLLLFVSACFFLVLGLCWYALISPIVLQLPNDFRYEADVISKDNFFDELRKQYEGETLSLTKFSYDILAQKNTNRIIRNIFDVRKTTGEKIFSVERLYGIHPVTQQHVVGYGDHHREGYLFAPRHLHKQPFTYWHVNYDEPARLTFRGEEKLFGVNVYRYETDYQADQTANLTSLPGVGKTRGVNLDIHLTVWVEPVSGHLVTYEDKTTAYYYDLATKKRIAPWNQFTNTYTQESVATHARIAQNEKVKIQLVERMLPSAFAGIGLLLLLAFFTRNKKRNLFNSILLLLPVVIFLINVGMWWYMSQMAQEKLQSKFDIETKDIEDTITQRIETYKNTLEGARALFRASKNVERNEWSDYITGTKILETYPGIAGLNFVEYIDNKQSLTKHIQRARADGLKNYSIRPEGERTIYAPITYVEPRADINLATLGFDVWSEELQRKALISARDSGNATMTEKITLVQDQVLQKDEAGILMILPVYKNGEPIATIEDRQKAIMGFATAPFRIQELMQEVLPTYTDIHFEITDGANNTSHDAVLYTYKKDSSQRNTSYTPTFQKTKTLYIASHPWTITFTDSSTFRDNVIESRIPLLILCGGSIFSLLLFGLFYSLTTSRRRAVTYAAKLTKDLLAAQKIGRFGNFIWNLKTNSVEWSDESFVIHGWQPSPNHVPPPLEEYLRIIHPEDVESSRKSIAIATKTKKENQHEYRVIWPDKSIHWVRVRSKIQCDPKNTPILLEGTFQDVTKEKEIDKAKTEFVSLSSHQLRTPLSAMNWFSEMLLNGDAGTLTKKQRGYVREIKSGNERMVSLVNALLNVSRIDLGTFSVVPKKINLVTICKEVLGEVQEDIAKKKLHLIKKWKKIPDIQADPNYIRIIFQNLLTNAVKYTPEKGTITVRITHDLEKFSIAVQDTGYGIPEKAKEKIFTKLFRAENVQQKEVNGTGLGLYIVKAIVEQAARGKIWFESTENKGTTFHVELPLSGMKKQDGSKGLV